MDRCHCWRSVSTRLSDPRGCFTWNNLGSGQRLFQQEVAGCRTFHVERQRLRDKRSSAVQEESRRDSHMWHGHDALLGFDAIISLEERISQDVSKSFYFRSLRRQLITFLANEQIASQGIGDGDWITPLPPRVAAHGIQVTPTNPENNLFSCNEL